ncbi:MAG: single-stranded-DNA-specific exonuclease RecJ [Rhodospirillales bacterium]
MTGTGLVASSRAGAPCLGVAASAGGRRWTAAAADERTALALAQAHGLPDLVARILAARGSGLDAVEAFLRPQLRTALPDPSVLRDMDRAAARLAAAIRAREPVAVFADYDVDGTTSAALLLRFCRVAGLDPRLYVPDRLTEGYGPNPDALRRLAAEGVRLVVTVDCGITAFDALEAAAGAGLEVVVVDHHRAEARLPPAVAVVNPNRLDEGDAAVPLRTLAAVGVTFLLVVATNRLLRSGGHYPDGGAPDLMGWLDLVALGTVCDVVALTGLNRALVSQGLKVMGRRGNTGLAALADVARVTGPPDAYHAGYILGPRVNAGGRLGGSELGARLLSTDDPAEAAALARDLDAFNARRRTVEAEVLDAAVAAVEAEGGDRPLILAAGEGWHPGVVGIVAARLKERFRRPAFAVALEGGIGKASGRSVPGVDLGGAVIAARQAGLLIAGGGHGMACGFTVAADRLGALRAYLEARVDADLAAGDADAGAASLGIDGVLTVGGATAELVGAVMRLGPFGTANPEPVFAIADARVVRADVVGGSHVRCILSGAAGGRLKAIAFRAVGEGTDEALGRLLLAAGGRSLHVAGTLGIDRWNGAETVQLRILDAAPAGGA